MLIPSDNMEQKIKNKKLPEGDQPRSPCCNAVMAAYPSGLNVEHIYCTFCGKKVTNEELRQYDLSKK